MEITEVFNDCAGLTSMDLRHFDTRNAGSMNGMFLDCSGLTRSVFFANGILLPRNASQQGRIGENLPLFSAEGKVVWDWLLPGDLVFWGREASDGKPAKATHVGIYIGDGRFIHSSFMVRINSLDPSSPDYYARKPLCARRIVGHVDAPDSGIISVFASPSYIPR